MRNSLRAGVIGAGIFGGYHAAKYLAAEGTVVTSIFDVDAARAQSLAEKCGATAARSLDAFLDAVDVVTVASPAETHFDIGRVALEAKRHVYMEKPLAMEVGHADILAELAEAHERVLFVGHQERVLMDTVGLTGLGETPGRLEFARCGPASGRCEEVSVVWDLMVHDLDLAARMVGSAPADVVAAGDDNEVAATVTFDNGAVASFLASRCSAVRRRSMTAAFDDGDVTVDFLARSLSSTRPGMRRRVEFGNLVADPLGAHVNAFLAAVRGEASDGVRGADARDSVILAAMVERARSRTNSRAVRPAGELRERLYA
ncbi:MAG: gfo/Idh/MocA family oxidoreductase [Alphaproteobacteria bacterium]|nr:gfo/Idh/MocA family oxidoreductase [Alphaproteobacteria bacterium]